MSKEVIKQEADALIQEPVKLTIDITPKNRIHAYLQSKKLLPKKKDYYVKPLVLGSLVRISKLLADLDIKKLEKGAFADDSIGMMKDHGLTMATIAAIAVTNEKKEPSKALIDLFLYHLSASELFKVVQIVLKQMDVQSFLLATISARQLSVIEMNPQS
jgi:hypothetical protein